MTAVVECTEGNSPLLLAVPHAGTWLPEAVRQRLSARGQQLADTDWHIDRLYRDLLPDVTLVKANFHRYLIDANRDPAGHSLYPGQNTTELCPTLDFDGEALWRADQGPGAADIADRLQHYHAPYHAALRAQIDRLRARHGCVLLYDCHSIRSRAPYLFDGELPVFNIGSNLGQSCSPLVEACVLQHCQRATQYSSVLNGRFRGGWTTRHYGQPQQQVHVIQMELAQRAYLASEAAPFAWSAERAEALQAVLRPLLQALVQLTPQLAIASATGDIHA